MLNKIEAFLCRMRCKAFFALNNIAKYDSDTDIPLFKTEKYPSAVKELSEFDKDLTCFLNKIRFRKRKNIFQKKLSMDNGELKKVKKIFVMGDKTKKLYDMSPRVYRQSN